MKRIVMMLIRNLYYLPYALIKLRWYLAHKEKYSEEKINAFFRAICKHAVRGGNIKIDISGVENFPKENGFMIFPNHQGMFDVLALILACPDPVTVVAKKETENIPVLRSILKLMGAQFIDREDLRQSMQVINQVAKEVKEGRNYIIFAEGTRSKNGNQLLEFKGGSFKAATKAQCPIVPAALIDSYKAFDTGSIQKINIKVCIQKPLYPEDYKGKKTVDIADEVKSIIEKTIQKNCE